MPGQQGRPYLWKLDNYAKWKAEEFSNSTWMLGSDQLQDEQDLINRLASQQPWEEQPDYAEMPYRPPQRCCLTEWDSGDDEALHYLAHLKGEIPAHIEDTEEMLRKIEFQQKQKERQDTQAAQEKKEQEAMVRMTRERMAILEALEKAGGEVADASGSATTKLALMVGRNSENLRPFTGILARMQEDGLITREINGKRTLRIALPKPGDEYSELTDALQVLGGSVEQNGEDAAALLMGAMQYEGTKRTFKDLLSRADRDGVISVARKGSRILSVTLVTDDADTTDVTREQDPDNVTDTTTTTLSDLDLFNSVFDRVYNDTTGAEAEAEVTLSPEDAAVLTEGLDDPEPAEDLMAAVKDDGDLQKLSLFLLDEVIARATAPASTEVLSTMVAEQTAALQAEHDKAVQVAIDRMNQLDVANHRIKELESSVLALEVQIKNLKKENGDLGKELGRRPVGPKVDEILRPDSRSRLESFKKLMQETPKRK